MEDTINLYDVPKGETFNPTYEMELIFGTADQLDINNERYIVDVQLPDVFTTLVDNTVFDIKLSATESRHLMKLHRIEEKQAEYTSTGRTIIAMDVDQAELEQYVALSNVSSVWTNYFSINLKPNFSGITATCYTGYYETEAEIEQALLNKETEDCTALMWNQSDAAMQTTGGVPFICGVEKGIPDTYYTIVLKRGETTIEVLPFTPYLLWSAYSGTDIDSSRTDYSYFDGVYLENEKNFTFAYQLSNIETVEKTEAIGIDGYKGIEYWQVLLNEGASKNETYNCTIHVNDLPQEWPDRINSVEKAVVGFYKTAEQIPTAAIDIKEQLFSDEGYPGIYSQGITFTIIGDTGRLYWINVKAYEFDDPNYRLYYGTLQPNAGDPYFIAFGADNNASYNLHENSDTYYYYGYQTVFVLTNTNDPVTASTITPHFLRVPGITVYASPNGGAAVKQTSGQSKIPFTSGKAVPYTATLPSGRMRNYWVTFLTQQSGPKLFVNGTNVESHYADVNGVMMPQREVYLTPDFDYYHDIFFANIGDEAINGLYVKLENAQNVALDNYWKINAITTLSPFTTVEAKDTDGSPLEYGELANFAKVRLVPTDTIGEISGTLVIGYDDGTNKEEVRINLTGTSGVPKITTETIVNGVKYVPYSGMIQTNNMYVSNDVQFSLESGMLPNGMELLPTGELYGVPTQSGTFTFTVKASYDAQGLLSDSKTYTLTILSNTDANVEEANTGEQGYALLDAVDREMNINSLSGHNLVFRSEGPFMSAKTIIMSN